MQAPSNWRWGHDLDRKLGALAIRGRSVCLSRLISLIKIKQIGVTVKKTKKICDEILERFGDGEYLRHICTGKDEYPDQATFWRWRQEDRDLAEQFMGSLIKNVSALSEKSELLITYAKHIVS